MSVTLQFSTTVNSWGNRWSWVIRHLSHSPFSHVDIELPDGSLLGSSDSPNASVVSGNPRGVAIRPNNYEQYGYRRRVVLDTDCDIVGAALTQLGKPFDNSALSGFISDKLPIYRDWRAEDRWFCSELVAWALEQSGFWGKIIAIWPKSRISPPDLLMILLFDLRWTNRETFWTESV